MENIKFTKGTWRYDEMVGSDYFPIYSDNSILVAEVNDHRPVTGLMSSPTPQERQEFIANAKLIAAAPELLKYLIKAESYISVASENMIQSEFHDFLIGMKEAIKKATE